MAKKCPVIRTTKLYIKCPVIGTTPSPDNYEQSSPDNGDNAPLSVLLMMD